MLWGQTVAAQGAGMRASDEAALQPCVNVLQVSQSLILLNDIILSYTSTQFSFFIFFHVSFYHMISFTTFYHHNADGQPIKNTNCINFHISIPKIF